MTQERTEQRDFAKDRKIIAAATPGPWRREGNLVIGYGKHLDRDVADCGIYNHPIDKANAIYTTESRTGWPAALDEIDRLNATIAGLQEAVREQTAKVQERDAEISRYRLLLEDMKFKLQEYND